MGNILGAVLWWPKYDRCCVIRKLHRDVTESKRHLMSWSLSRKTKRNPPGRRWVHVEEWGSVE